MGGGGVRRQGGGPSLVGDAENPALDPRGEHTLVLSLSLYFPRSASLSLCLSASLPLCLSPSLSLYLLNMCIPHTPKVPCAPLHAPT